MATPIPNPALPPAEPEFEHTLPLNLSHSFKEWAEQTGYLKADHFSCPILPSKWLLQEDGHGTADLSGKIWLHGFVSVFIVSICAVFGAILVPYTRQYKVAFQLLMLYLVALAVSALSGAAILVLLPEGLGLMNCDLNGANIWVCVGIFSCFVINQLIKHLAGVNERGYDAHPADHLPLSDKSPIPGQGHNHGYEQTSLMHESDASTTETSKRSLTENLRRLKPAGWMCLIGDAFHNLLDGIAIGCTFSLSGINAGWQLSIAILAEEFPHELGDFAVLLQAGLSVRQAIICNLFSAATCLLGFILGMFYGEFFGLTVFAWMGGVFFFISLSSILPELDEHIVMCKRDKNVVEKTPFGETGIVLISILGLMTGYGIVYSCGFVDFDSINLFEE